MEELLKRGQCTSAACLVSGPGAYECLCLTRCSACTCRGRLFGDQDEVLTEYLQQQGNDYGYVYCAVNWLGMSKYDEVAVGIMIATDVTNFGTNRVCSRGRGLDLFWC